MWVLRCVNFNERNAMHCDRPLNKMGKSTCLVSDSANRLCIICGQAIQKLTDMT